MPAELQPLIRQSAVCTLIICEVMELLCSRLTTSPAAAAALCYAYSSEKKFNYFLNVLHFLLNQGSEALILSVNRSFHGYPEKNWFHGR